MPAEVYGLDHLRSWPVVLQQAREISGTAVVAVIGDSWVYNDYITGPIRKALQDDAGDGGIGYIGIGMRHGAPQLGTAIMTRTGEWIDRDNVPEPVGRGIDLADATTLDATAAVSVTADADRMVLHLLKQPGGGTFEYQIDAGPWRRVATDAITDTFATTPIAMPDGRHTLRIEIDDPGGAGVTLFGVDVQRSAGVRVHRIGNNGATSAQYLGIPRPVWLAELRALNPDVVCILLGTNDQTKLRPWEFHDAISAMIERVRAATPAADIVLLSPSDNGNTEPSYPLGMYRDALWAVAAEQQVTFVDPSERIGPFAPAFINGLYTDPYHLSEIGGQVFAGVVLQRALVP